jgi:hypothetical protein
MLGAHSETHEKALPLRSAIVGIGMEIGIAAPQVGFFGLARPIETAIAIPKPTPTNFAFSFYFRNRSQSIATRDEVF